MKMLNIILCCRYDNANISFGQQSGVTQIAYFERPMLVTNVGGLAEIVPNKKVGYVTPKNPIKIADAIIFIQIRWKIVLS